MNNEPLNLRNIAKKISSEGYFERARQRAKRRKSPWNLVLIPLGLSSIGFIFYDFFQIMWHVHTLFYPEHSGRLGPSKAMLFMNSKTKRSGRLEEL